MLTDERDKLGGSGHRLGDEEHEDGEGEQNGDAERDLLAAVRRQPESEQAENAEPETRKDDVEEVVQRPSTHEEEERHVRVRLDAAGVEDFVPLRHAPSRKEQSNFAFEFRIPEYRSYFVPSETSRKAAVSDFSAV